MKPSGGAVFGKPSTRRSFSGSEALPLPSPSPKPPEGDGLVKESHKSKTDAKLRLIQLEIAEKEACNVLRALCLDASMLLPPSEQALEVEDLLSGVLLLGSLCKRIGYEKEQTEKRLAIARKEHDTALADKKSLVDQLEGVVLRLQADNLRLTDQIGEIGIKNSQKVAVLTREIFTQRESMEELKAENTKAGTKIQYLERRMMEVPRLEEGYMRQARGMIRQQEMSNTMNKIEWKRIEEEAKQAQFWKGKAKALDEELMAARAEVDHLTNLARSNFTKFQQATMVVNSMKQGGKSYTGVLSKQQTASGIAKQLTRPASAPSLRKHSRSALLPSDEDDPAQSRPLPRTSSRMSGGDDLKLRAEVTKLTDSLAAKSAQVLKLSQQLSRARAYPLMSAQRALPTGGWVKDDDSLPGIDDTAARIAKTKRASFAEYDDLELTAEEEAEEGKLEEDRIGKALQVQREYNDRTQRTRAANPPHIAAIRNSRSFAKDS